MKTVISCIRIAVAACCLATGAADARDAHVKWADDLVAHITPAANDCLTNPSYIYWAGVNGKTAYANRTLAGSFITLLLQQAYGWTNSNFKAWFGSTSPTAAVYHDAIAAQNRFTLVTNVHAIQAGDILAIKYSEPGNTVTGHVMMADGAAQVRASTKPIVSGLVQYELKVIDSASTGHTAAADTRMLPNGAWDSGAGRGTLRLYVDINDNVVGYSWSTEGGSAYYSQQSPRHLLIGRVN